MSLPVGLVKEFAKVTKDKKDSPRMSFFNATVISVDENGHTQVKIDGTETITPVTLAMDARVEDRVVVMIKDRQAFITGNTSSPASARTAGSYMQLTEDMGLIIGNLDDQGNPTGMYCSIFDGRYRIVTPDDIVIASFGSDDIVLCNDKGMISVVDDSLVLESNDAVGLRSDEISGESTLNSEVICRGSSVAMQSKRDGIVENSVVCDSSNGVHIHTKEGQNASVNGFQLLNADNSFIFGRIVRENGVILSGQSLRLTFDIVLNPGYKILAVQSIQTNRTDICSISSFLITNGIPDVTPSTITVTINNVGASDINNLKLWLDWAAALIDHDGLIIDNGVEWPISD